MAFGEGKYDDLVQLVREKSEAMDAMVIVIRGNKGNGFSQQFVVPKNYDPTLHAAMLLEHAATLRLVADEMQKDARHLRAKTRGN